MTALKFLKWYFENEAEIDAAGGDNANPSPIIIKLKENTWAMSEADRWLVHKMFNKETA